MRWWHALLALPLVAAGPPGKVVLTPPEFDPFIRRADGACERSESLAREAAKRGLRDAANRRRAVYQERIREFTRAGDLESAQVIKDTLERLERESETAPSKAPEHVAEFGGHSYALFKEAATWHLAKASCERRGGHLVIVDSEKELAFLDSLAGGNRFWVGASDEEEEGHFRWIDGTDADIKGPLIDNDLGAENWVIRDTKQRLYNDFPSMRVYYICEWDE